MGTYNLPRSRSTLFLKDADLKHSCRSHFLSGFQLTNVHVIKLERLDSKYLSEYPTQSIPFYLYGIPSELHIDHALLASPNIQLNSDRVKIELTGPGKITFTDTLVVHLMGVPENAMQPFPANKDIAREKQFFFRPNAVYDIVITKDFSLTTKIAEGKMQLSDTVFTDTDMLNMDPVPDEHQHLHGALDRFASEGTTGHLSVPLLAKETATANQKWAAFVVRQYLAILYNVLKFCVSTEVNLGRHY